MCIPSTVSATSTPPVERITGSRVGLFVPERLHNELREVARATDRPLSRVIRAALEDVVERHRQEVAVGD
jgi:hypothetical protein